MKALFGKQDLFLLKWQITFALLCVALSQGIYLGVDRLFSQSAATLAQARANFDNARSSVDLIEEEEATIIRYIDRYRQLSQDGIVDGEDRLQFLEHVADIRAENDLFPISLNIGEQTAARLEYNTPDPGAPVDLKSSTVELTLPLLHEEDLTRLLEGILTSPGLYQVKECQVNLRSNAVPNFFALGQHLSASCGIYWYTFEIDLDAG